MRLSLSLSIIAVLFVAPLAACEFHAEAGHPNDPSTAPAATTPPVATAAPAPTPTTTTTIRTGGLHLTASDAGL